MGEIGKTAPWNVRPLSKAPPSDRLTLAARHLEAWAADWAVLTEDDGELVNAVRIVVDGLRDAQRDVRQYAQALFEATAPAAPAGGEEPEA